MNLCQYKMLNSKIGTEHTEGTKDELGRSNCLALIMEFIITCNLS